MTQPTLWQLWSVPYSDLMLQRNLMPRGAWVLCEPKEIFTWLLTLSKISVGRNYYKEKDHKPSHHILRQFECLTSLWIDICAKDIETSAWSTGIIIISVEISHHKILGKFILKLYPSLIELPGSYLLLQEFSLTSLFFPNKINAFTSPLQSCTSDQHCYDFWHRNSLYTLNACLQIHCKKLWGFWKNHVNIHCLLVFTFLLELEFSTF